LLEKSMRTFQRDFRSRLPSRKSETLGARSAHEYYDVRERSREDDHTATGRNAD
jgi:hypothetical protein